MGGGREERWVKEGRREGGKDKGREEERKEREREGLQNTMFLSHKGGGQSVAAQDGRWRVLGSGKTGKVRLLR